MADIRVSSTIENVAFLFIDLQPVFTAKYDNTEFQTNIETALCYARKRVSPNKIVHVRANYVGSAMVPYSLILNPNLSIPSDIQATTWAVENSNEYVLEKSTINGFHETELSDYLKSIHVDTIVLAGLLTCACVHETAIGGLNRGFRPILLENVCVDKTKEKHEAVIALYKNYLYQTCTLNEFITAFPV